MKHLNLPPNWTHRHYDSVASTMLCCDTDTLQPGEFLLITADEQTAGRGQRGTKWESTKGQNLTFNIGWRPDHSLPWPLANEQFLISEITALAVLNALADSLNPQLSTFRSARSDARQSENFQLSPLTIKWPNDIYVGDRKICGMLLEHQLSGKRIEASIAGIGINVNQQSFLTEAGKSEGRGAPISLRGLIGHDVERETVLEAFVRHFMEGIRLLSEGRYDDVERTFLARLYRRTGTHRYRDAEGEFSAEFVSIARNGLLTLRKADGTLHDYAFKEVVYVVD